MTQVIASGERVQSLGEEIANSVSYGIGLLTAAATAPVLNADAVPAGASSLSP